MVHASMSPCEYGIAYFLLYFSPEIQLETLGISRPNNHRFWGRCFFMFHFSCVCVELGLTMLFARIHAHDVPE